MAKSKVTQNHQLGGA